MSSLALSMIIRDAAGFLPQCLESVRAIVDEIVVADTGSRNASKEIARSFATRVIEVPWHDNFAEARNLCLREVHSAWVLSLDADEMLEPGVGPRLVQLISSQREYGYQVTIRNFVLSLQDRIWDQPASPNNGSLPAGKIYPAYVDHQNVRLFRNDPNIRFTGRVHESVGPSLLKLQRRILPANFLIYHFGLAVSADERAAKNIFYRQLGRQKLLDAPNDAQAHLELGLVEMDNFADLDEALRLFSRACQLNPRFGPAWFFQGLLLLRQHQFAQALDCLNHAASLGHRSSLVAETQGDAHYNLGSYRHAASSYQTALNRDPANPWLASKLGLALVRCGESAAGLRNLDLALESCPGSAELYDRKMLAFLSLENPSGAALTLEAKLSQVAHPAASDFLRAASLWSKAGDLTRASRLIELGLQAFPDDKKLLIARVELSPQTLFANSHSSTS